MHKEYQRERQREREKQRHIQEQREREERKHLSHNIIEKFGDTIDDLLHNESWNSPHSSR